MPKTPLFKFELWPINEILPWEDGEIKRLHWFGLTDGWYTMDCGGTKLMRHSQRLIDATPHWNRRTPYFDYQVARLHEDVLDILPHAIDPVPSDLLDLVRTESNKLAFEQAYEEWLDTYLQPSPKPSSTAHDLRSEQALAFSWWFEKRHLSRGHMAGQPHIQIWSEAELLHIHWINTCGIESETGLPWNDIPDGQYTMPIVEFLEEVRSFHNRLMNAMRERLETARSAWPLPDVAIDINQLSDEHESRTRSLEQALMHSADTRTDWDAVRRAVHRVGLNKNSD